MSKKAMDHVRKMVDRLQRKRCPFCNHKAKVDYRTHQIKVRAHPMSIETIPISRTFAHIDCKKCKKKWRLPITSRTTPVEREEFNRRVQEKRRRSLLN
jgi:transcription elongation factor Elf1